MYSKLEEMRNQFRERLTLRPEESKIHFIKVEHQGNNNNNNDYYPKVASNVTNVSKISNIGHNLKDNTNPFVSTKLSENRSAYKPITRQTVTSDKSLAKNVINKEPKRYTDWNNNLKTSSKLTTNGNKYGNKELLRTPKRPNVSAIRPARPIASTKRQLRGTGRVSFEGTPCRFCGRYFALTERLEKHESVCTRNSAINESKYRFDSMKQRFKGKPNEYLKFYEDSLANKEEEVPKKWNWRQKHEYCLATIRAARGDTYSGPTTSEITASTQQQCDYCKRRFNDDAIK
ncbi:unnamed protein product, partial [Oppiella nova]